MCRCKVYLAKFNYIHTFFIFLQARTDNTWVQLSNLETGSEYNITVIAANNYGFSIFTPSITKRIWSEEVAKEKEGKRRLISHLEGLAVPGVIIAA